MKNKNTKIKKDIAMLTGLPVLASAVAWLLRLDFLLTTILFFAPPAAYLAYQDKRNLRRNLIFAGCFTIAGIYTDYMAEKDLAWMEPSSLFHFRVAGIVPIESLVWFFLLTFLVISFYEHFFDHVRHKAVGRNMKFLFAIIAAASVAFFLPLAIHKEYPVINYFYLKLGLLLGIVPLAAFVFEFPRFLSAFLKTAPYFMGLSLLNEFVGLHNGHWLFPGRQFIGWIDVGTFRFPLEELLFWMILFSSVVIAYFEAFDDNRLKFRFRRS